MPVITLKDDGMNRQLIIMAVAVLLVALGACASMHKGNGWYQLAEFPDNTIVGKPLVTAYDFEEVVLIDVDFVAGNDTVKRFLIQGRVKPEKRGLWADETERLIGHRIGFVFNDSVITSPQINTRIESGSFQITSPDTTLIRNIYNSLKSSQIQ